MHTLWQKLRTNTAVTLDLHEEKERHAEFIGAEFGHVCAWGWGRAAWRSNDLDDGARAAAPTHPLPTPVQHCLGPRALIQRLLVGNRNKDADRWRGEAISRALMW